MTQASKPALLRETLASGQFVVAPGVYAMLSAKIADRLGFHALYMTALHQLVGFPDVWEFEKRFVETR
ncbi:MAG: hypothetical protein ACO3BH_05120 [Quisquiliibacterium sp.]